MPSFRDLPKKVLKGSYNMRVISAKVPQPAAPLGVWLQITLIAVPGLHQQQDSSLGVSVTFSVSGTG